MVVSGCDDVLVNVDIARRNRTQRRILVLDVDLSVGVSVDEESSGRVSDLLPTSAGFLNWQGFRKHV